jgi:hypothetical protein
MAAFPPETASMPPSDSHRLPAAPGRRSGNWLVVALLALGVGLALFALVFQRRQTDGCLDFYGSVVARAISTAPHVELWHLTAGPQPGSVRVRSRCDVSGAPGLVHLRRGLVEDANFAGGRQGGGRLPADAWTVALAFAPAAGTRPTAILAWGGGPQGGSLCVVGRAGRVGLGRLEQGLRTWVAAACPAPEAAVSRNE